MTDPHWNGGIDTPDGSRSVFVCPRCSTINNHGMYPCKGCFEMHTAWLRFVRALAERRYSGPVDDAQVARVAEMAAKTIGRSPILRYFRNDEGNE